LFVEKLKQAIEDEYRAYYFYKSMLQLTNDPYWQSFIKHALEDEKSHYEMFQQLHYMMTGSFVPNPKKPVPAYHLKDAAKRAIVDELEAVDTYKEMLLTIPMQQAYNPLFIAMQDELEHAIRFSTMYNAL
jgi:rubrerythrin